MGIFEKTENNMEGKSRGERGLARRGARCSCATSVNQSSWACENVWERGSCAREKFRVGTNQLFQEKKSVTMSGWGISREGSGSWISGEPAVGFPCRPLESRGILKSPVDSEGENHAHRNHPSESRTRVREFLKGEGAVSVACERWGEGGEAETILSFRVVSYETCLQRSLRDEGNVVCGRLCVAVVGRTTVRGTGSFGFGRSGVRSAGDCSAVDSRRSGDRDGISRSSGSDADTGSGIRAGGDVSGLRTVRVREVQERGEGSVLCGGEDRVGAEALCVPDGLRMQSLRVREDLRSALQRLPDGEDPEVRGQGDLRLREVQGGDHDEEERDRGGLSQVGLDFALRLELKNDERGSSFFFCALLKTRDKIALKTEAIFPNQYRSCTGRQVHRGGGRGLGVLCHLQSGENPSSRSHHPSDQMRVPRGLIYREYHDRQN